MSDLRRLEEDGWRALATEGAGPGFYGELLDDDAVMVFPGMVLRGRDAILPTMAGPPWDEFTLSDVEVRTPVPGTGVVSYRVAARRGGHDYAAHLTSVYVRSDDGAPWRLVLHQHTPDPTR